EGHLCDLRPLFAPVHGRRDEGFGLVAGSSVPTEPFGENRTNGGKLRWAVTGSNRRPSRCKSERRPQIRRFFTISKSECASLSLLAHARSGSARTGRTSREIGLPRTPISTNGAGCFYSVTHNRLRRSGDGDARSPALRLCRCSSKVERSPRKVEMSVQVRPLAPVPLSSSGRTLGFGPRNRGSNPCGGTKPSWRNRIALPASNRTVAGSNPAEGTKV